MQPTPRQISHDLQMYVVGLLLWLSCRVGTRLHIGAILLCRGISPFADVNILIATLPVSHTKTVFRYTHKAVGLFHRLWTPSRWPAVSPHTFVRVSLPPSISSSFKLNSACSLLEDKNTVPPSVTAIPMRPGIFETVLSFNRPLT